MRLSNMRLPIMKSLLREHSVMETRYHEHSTLQSSKWRKFK